MLNILFEVTPIDPTTGLQTTVRMSAIEANASGVQLNGFEWLPTVVQWPERDIALTSDGELTSVSVSHGTISFSIVENRDWCRLYWPGAYGRLFVGNMGDPFASYVQIYEGECGPFSTSAGMGTVTLAGNERALDVDLLPIVYAGTGSAEGPATIKGNVKPRAYGNCQNVEPVLIDAAKLIYQVHDGSISAVSAVYEQALTLGAATSTASATYAALAALTLTPGQWASAPAVGMFRLGGQPTGKITADVLGALSGSTYVSTLGTILPLMMTNAAVPASKVSTSSFSAWTQAWSFYSTEQVNVGDTIRDALASAGGYLITNSAGVFCAADFYGANTATPLATDGSSAVHVLSCERKEDASPVYSVKIGHTRAWSVNSASEVSPALATLNSAVTTSQAAADDARNKANQAQADANTANTRIASISADGVLDRSEKPTVVQTYQRLAANVSNFGSQATALGVSRTAMDSAKTSLDSYLGALTPQWDTVTVDTPIDGPTFRTNFQNAENAVAALAVAIAAKAATIATWDGVTGKDAFVTQANTASTNATAAIAQLSNIANDNVLSKNEKSDAILDWTMLSNDYNAMIAQAASLTVAYTSFTAAYNALASYLGGLSPQWNDVTTDTNIVANSWRSKWADAFTQKIALANALAAKAATTSTWDGVSGTGKDALVSQAATAASNASAALTQLGMIANDNVLSRGEKGQVMADWQAISSEGTPLAAQATALNVDATAFANARTALASYLGGLTPQWNDLTQDTTIDGPTFRQKFADYYTAKVNLTNALAASTATVRTGINAVRLSNFPQGSLRGFLPDGYKTATVSGASTTSTAATTHVLQTGMNLTSWFGIRNVAYATLDNTLPTNEYLDVWGTYSPWGVQLAGGRSMSQAIPWMMPVKNGDAVYATVRLAHHRCNAQLFLLVYNAAGSMVQAPNWIGGRAQGAGGGDPANFDVVGGVTAIAASDAAYAALMVRMLGTGENGPYVFLTEPAMGVLPAGQTVAPPYFDGQGDPMGDQTAVNTAADTTKVAGQLSSDVTSLIASTTTTANAANNTANSAQSFVNDVADNNKVTQDEKKRWWQMINQWSGDVPKQSAKARECGFVTEGNALDTAWNNWYNYLVNTVQVYNFVRTTIDRTTFLNYATAFTNADKVVATALQSYAKVLAQHPTNANLILDPRYDRPTDTACWASFPANAQIQDSGDGRRVVVTANQPGDVNIITGNWIVGPYDRIDVEMDCYLQGSITNEKLFGINFTVFDGSGNTLGGTGVLKNTTVMPRETWFKVTGSTTVSNIGSNYTSAAAIRCQIVTQPNGGNVYFRNPNAYRVPAANQKLAINGRGTTSLLNSSNLVAGIKIINNTGFTLTNTNTGTNVTVNIGALNYTLDNGVVINYPAGSAGGLAYSTTYYFWRVDPDLNGGSSYGASSNIVDAVGPDKVYLGYFTTMAATGTGGGGGGGGTDRCVDADAFVEVEGKGPIRARDVAAADRILCLTVDMTGTEFVEVQANDVHSNLCVTITTAKAELMLALNTPIPRKSGDYVLAANAAHAPVPVSMDGKDVEWIDATVEAAGLKPVAAISCFNRVYGAGTEPGRYIFSHNLAQKP